MKDMENLNIQNVRAFHSYLSHEIKNNDSIVIDMKDVLSIDASCIQLLISCKKSCLAQDKSFAIENLSDDLYDTFALIGADIFLEV